MREVGERGRHEMVMNGDRDEDAKAEEKTEKKPAVARLRPRSKSQVCVSQVGKGPRRCDHVNASAAQRAPASGRRCHQVCGQPLAACSRKEARLGRAYGSENAACLSRCVSLPAWLAQARVCMGCLRNLATGNAWRRRPSPVWSGLGRLHMARRFRSPLKNVSQGETTFIQSDLRDS